MKSECVGLAAAPCHLYFGCRSERKDFYYKDEWREMQAKGILAKEGGLVCAFSRDQDRKVYVTQKLQDNAKQLWSLISQVRFVLTQSGDLDWGIQMQETAYI